MRSFLKYLSVIIAVILTTISLTYFTTLERAMSPSLYTNALQNSGIYTQMTAIIEDKLTHALTNIAKELRDQAGINEDENAEHPQVNKFLVWLVDTIIDTQTGKLVTSVTEEYGLETRIQNSTEDSIQYSIDWLNGDVDAPAVFNYIPTPEQIEDLERDGIVRRIAINIVEETLGLSELPDCKNSTEEMAAMEELEKGNYDKVTCTSDTVQPLIDEEINRLIPDKVVDGFQADLDEFIEKYDLEPVLGDIYDLVKDLGEFKQAALDLKEGVRWSRYAYTALFIASIPFVALAVFLAQKDRLRTFLMIYMAVGIALLIVVAMHQLVFTPAIMGSLNFDELSIADEVISPTRSALFVTTLEDATSSIVRGLTSYTIIAGLVLVTFTGLPALYMSNREKIWKALPTKKTEKNK